MATGTVHHLLYVTGLLGLTCSCAQSDVTKQNTDTPTAIEQRSPDDSMAHYPPEDVADPAEIKQVIAYFDANLKGLGQRVRSCDGVVRLQIGKDSLIYGRGLAAFGAYCTLGNGQSVVMCYEEAAGRFAIISGSSSQEKSWIAAATSRTCVEP